MTTSTTLADFLAARFRQNDPADRIELRTFNPDETPGPRKWFADPHEAARTMAPLPGRLAVYYGANPRVAKGGSKDHVTAVIGAYADLDFKRYPDGEAGAWAALEAFPLPPTWVIHSGGGLQSYWDFAERIADREHFARFEELLARLAARLGADPAVAEIARVLRVPGSTNGKREYDTPRPVTIARHNPAARYTLAELARALPAPQEQERPRSAYPRGDHRAGDVPSVDEVADMLRHLDPQPGYQAWLRLLASVHSAYPGADGIALCEAWSGHVSKPGEIAAKFASFGKYRGPHGDATIGTLVYEAKLAGWRPERATYHHDPPEATPGEDAGDDPDASCVAQLRAENAALRAENATLRAENATLKDERRRADEEAERAILRTTELEEEVAVLHANRRHPNQRVAGCVWDVARGLIKRRKRHQGQVIDGQEHFAAIGTQDAKERSSSTFNRAVAEIRAAGHVPWKPLPKEIHTADYDGPQDITVFHVPDEHFRSEAALVRYLMPPAPEKKHWGGDHRVAVPQSEEHPDAPIVRRHETIETFHSLADKRRRPLAPPKTVQTVERHFTKDGDPISYNQARDIMEQLGYEPPRRKPWDPRRALTQVASILNRDTPTQVASTPPEPIHGSCHCGRANLPGERWCDRHRPDGPAWLPIFEQSHARQGAD